MIELAESYLFAESVFAYLHQQLVKSLGLHAGNEALSTFATIVLNFDLPKDLLDVLRQGRLPIEEASVAYFDASITALKESPSFSDLPDELIEIVERMEVALNQMYLSGAGLALPKNGSAGPSIVSLITEH